MKVELLNFAESEAFIEANNAREEYLKASNARLDFEHEHLHDTRSLQQEAFYQRELRELLLIEKYLYDRWVVYNNLFVEEVGKRFSQPTSDEEEIMRSIIDREHDALLRKHTIKMKGLGEVPFKY